jgi:hypothetical protein
MKRLIPFLIFLLPMSVFAGTFGIEASYSFNMDVRDAIIGGAMTCDGDGTSDSISVSINTSGSGCSVRVALYLVSAALDTVLVDSSSHKAVSSGTAWYDVILQENATIYADSLYYLCVSAYDCGSAVNVRFNITCSADPDPPANCPWTFRTRGWSSVWPSSLTSTTETNNREVSIHCDYTDAVVAAGKIIIIMND